MTEITVRILGIENLRGVTLPDTVTVRIEAPDRAEPERVTWADAPLGPPVATAQFVPTPEHEHAYPNLRPGEVVTVLGRVGIMSLVRFKEGTVAHVYTNDLIRSRQS